MAQQSLYSTRLSLLPPGDGAITDECQVCQEFGACRNWIETMAAAARVSANWLAAQVYENMIDHNWSVEEVRNAHQRR
jgi:hypothetical protein